MDAIKHTTLIGHCRSTTSEPLLPPADPAAEPSEQPQSSERPTALLACPESETSLPSQTGTLKILALVLFVVALLVGAAALSSRSGVVQQSGPPPACRKSAAMAVLLHEDSLSKSPLQSTNAGILDLLVWGGKGKRAELVFDDAHVMNLQDCKWHSVKQKAFLAIERWQDMPGLRNLWKSTSSKHIPEITTSRLPESRWKQLTVTDDDSSSMIMFGGDGMDANINTTGNGHNYFNDAWQLTLHKGKARWQELWNTGPDGTFIATVYLSSYAACIFLYALQAAANAFQCVRYPLPCSGRNKDKLPRASDSA